MVFLAQARLEYYKKNYTGAITAAKNFVGRYKTSAVVFHALMVIAQAYKKMGNAQNANAIYKKILAGAKESALIDAVKAAAAS